MPSHKDEFARQQAQLKVDYATPAATKTALKRSMDEESRLRQALEAQEDWSRVLRLHLQAQMKEAQRAVQVKVEKVPAGQTGKVRKLDRTNAEKEAALAAKLAKAREAKAIKKRVGMTIEMAMMVINGYATMGRLSHLAHRYIEEQVKADKFSAGELERLVVWMSAHPMELEKLDRNTIYRLATGKAVK